MKKRVLCALLCALLLMPLCACGRTREAGAPAAAGGGSAAPAAGGSVSAPAQSAAVPAGTESAAVSFPLLSAPFSEAETEAMVNHNAARFALLDVNFYYTRSYYADGSCALVRYEVIDSGLHRRTVLLDGCPADYLAAADGRLYYLDAEGQVESLRTDGTDRRVELDTPCRSLQLRDGALLCLTADGTLLEERGGESCALLGGCLWAYVSDEGIFYTALADGRAHLYRPETQTDLTLTAAAAETPTVIGQLLYYLTPEDDGGHICALDLMSGESFRMELPVRGAVDFIPLRGGWAARVFGLRGESHQSTVSCASLFSSSPETSADDLSHLCVCRGLDGALRTDEILSPDGVPLGTALVLPDGSRYAMYAEDKPRN